MRFRHRDRTFPELNTTSTADISFMLLVFFLVTSSMDADKGLSRRLSPMDNERQETRDIQRDNVLTLTIDDDNRISCDQQTVTLQELQQQVASFVASRQNDRYVIAVETGRHTSYDAYFSMQDAIVAAYRQLRDRMALKQYGHRFAQCTPEERDVVARRYPLRISEGVAVEVKN